MSDLRAELGARPDPEFELLLPPGWERHDPSAVTEEAFVDAARRRLMQSAQPQLQVELQRELARSFSHMRQQRVVALFAPSLTAGDDALFVPASLTAAFQGAERATNLDATVREAVRERGAVALLGDPRTIVFEKEATRVTEAGPIITHARNYLTPVPGTSRRRALRFVAGFGRTPDMPADDESLVRMRQLFDACVSTLRWKRAVSPEGAA